MNQTINKIGNFRWTVVILLFFATTINYIDRQVIGILKPFIAEDLGWSEADYGYIITAFQIAYGIGLIVFGSVLDKVGTRIGYLWAVAVWSVAGVLHAAVRSVGGFIFARFALGLGESANFPAAVKSVAEWFPVKERAFATGLFNSGSTVGAIMGPIIVSAVMVTYGWRMAFIITGALGVVWMIFWLIFYQHPSKQRRLTKREYDYIHQDNQEAQPNTSITWLQLFRYKATYAICATRFLTDWVWWFILFWVPGFLTTKGGIDIRELVLPLIIIYGISSLGGIAGGWTSSQFIKSGRSVDFSRKTAVLLGALLALPLILASQVENFWVFVILIGLAAAAHQSWASNIFSITSDIYPKSMVGSMIGLSGFAGAIGGALSATFVGLLLEATHSYALIFTIASTMYLLSWLIIKIFIPKIDQIVPFKIKQSGSQIK